MLPASPPLPSPTSSVHRPWFLFLGVPPFPEVLPQSSSATQRMHPCTGSIHRPLFPFSASSSSYFLLTLSLYSTIISSLGIHHLICFGTIVLFFLHFFMRTSKTTGLCCVVTYSPANALQFFTASVAEWLRAWDTLTMVWSYGVREVVSSIPDRGNIVRMMFYLTRWLVRFSHLKHAFPSKFWIYLEHCPRGEAVITGHLCLSSMR